MTQQKSRKARRWLLPFTTGVDLSTIASALRLAETGGSDAGRRFLRTSREVVDVSRKKEA